MAFEKLRKWLAGPERTLSNYRPGRPVVLLRVTSYAFTGTGLTTKPAPEAAKQIADAVAAIRGRYGSEVRLRVWAAHSDMTDRTQASARLLSQALQPQTDGTYQTYYYNLLRFFAEVQPLPDVVDVVVSNEPSVLWALVKVQQAQDVTARHGEPHFLLVSQARTGIQMPQYQLTLDNPSA